MRISLSKDINFQHIHYSFENHLLYTFCILKIVLALVYGFTYSCPWCPFPIKDLIYSGLQVFFICLCKFSTAPLTCIFFSCVFIQVFMLFLQRKYIWKFPPIFLLNDDLWGVCFFFLFFYLVSKKLGEKNKKNKNKENWVWLKFNVNVPSFSIWLINLVVFAS